MGKKTKVVIIGAAGRDFHNFNTVYRDNPDYEVVAFTAYQIPNISGRRYPAALAGSLYPEGIPIYEEKDLPALIDRFKVDEVVLPGRNIRGSLRVTFWPTGEPVAGRVLCGAAG